MPVLDVFCSYYTVISAISYVQLLYHVDYAICQPALDTRKQFIRVSDGVSRHFKCMHYYSLLGSDVNFDRE